MEQDRATNDVVAKYSAQQAAAGAAYKAALKRAGDSKDALLKAEHAFAAAQETAAAEQTAGMKAADEKYTAAEREANVVFQKVSAEEAAKEKAKAAEDEREYELNPLVGDPRMVPEADTKPVPRDNIDA